MEIVPGEPVRWWLGSLVVRVLDLQLHCVPKNNITLTSIHMNQFQQFLADKSNRIQNCGYNTLIELLTSIHC